MKIDNDKANKKEAALTKKKTLVNLRKEVFISTNAYFLKDTCPIALSNAAKTESK
jgi:hypothetical protein